VCPESGGSRNGFTQAEQLTLVCFLNPPAVNVAVPFCEDSPLTRTEEPLAQEDIARRRRARWTLLLAAFLWSLSGVFIKSPLLNSLPVDSSGPILACWRALAAGTLLLPFVRFRKIRWRPALVPMVVSFAVMNLLFITSMTRTTAAAAIFLQYTATVWASILSYFVLKERVQKTTLFAMTGAVAGITWIVVSESGSANSLGNILAIGSGISYSCVLVSIRFLRDEDAAWLTALNHLAAGIVLLPWVLSFDVSLSPSQFAVVVFLGVVQMGLPYVLYARCVRDVPVTEAVFILLLEPLLNPLWVSLFWTEPVNPHVWVGGAMILGGLVVKYTLDARKPREAASVIAAEQGESESAV
jgi:drug/metabolite transporter, DME family